MRGCNLPLRKTMCSTCPFREGSPYAYLVEDLTYSALTEGSRICHSTGSNNGINKRTGLPSHLCRGARDIQLKQFVALGVIREATDEAWNEARVLIGMEPTLVENQKQKEKANAD